MTPLKRLPAARALIAVAAFATLGGCATKGDLRNLQEEIRVLTIRQDSLITELRAATASTQDTLREQSGQLFDFRGEITRLLRDVREEMAQLRALTGENQRGIVGLRDQMVNLRRAAPTQPTGVPTGDSAVVSGGVSEELPGAAGADADQLWTVATEQLSRGSLTTAQRAFEQFVREHPNHARTPDAYFFLADILVQQDRPDEAMEAFREVQSRFPSAPRVPDALYRIAILQLEAGNVDAARDTLQRIVNTYPDTAIALIARDKLEEIGECGARSPGPARNSADPCGVRSGTPPRTGWWIPGRAAVDVPCAGGGSARCATSASRPMNTSSSARSRC